MIDLNAIRQVLLTDWDPSNIGPSQGSPSAYDADLEPLHQLIESGATQEAVVDYLHDREQSIMCFPSLGKRHLQRVAEKLLNLRSTP